MTSSRNYICSERAHFMCPNMHFGIMAQIGKTYNAKQVSHSVNTLQSAHPFLQSLVTEEDGTGRFYYQRQNCLKISVEEKAECDLWQHDYEQISSRGWDVRKEGLLKILVYPKERGFCILFIAHHLLCDGRGLLQLAEEFAQHYVHAIKPQYVEEQLIRSLQDFPENSDLPLLSKLIIGHANKSWKKEQHCVRYENYAAFEQYYIRKNHIEREIITVENDKLEKLHNLCRQQGISINDFLIADMMIKDGVNKVVIAADIRNQITCYRPGALGNYSTAFSIVVHKKDDDQMLLAKRIARKVADIMKHPRKAMLVLACYLYMEPELIDAVAIATLGDFESRAGKFVGTNMFGYGSQNGYSITNLGRIQSDAIEEAAFIPPASPANRKTLGVLTVNGSMKICTVVRSSLE